MINHDYITHPSMEIIHSFVFQNIMDKEVINTDEDVFL